MSTNLTAVLQELWQNTTNLKVLRQLMTTDATYVSLNLENPELKKVMPWAGTHKGPQALPDVFAAIQRFWKTLDFKVTDTIEQVPALPPHDRGPDVLTVICAFALIFAWG